MRETYTKVFNEIGYTNFDFLDICDEHLHSDFHFKRVEAAKTVFFTGGDQSRICRSLKQSVLTDLLKRKYQEEDGFMIAGTSAGAMCMPKIMIVEALNGEAMLEHDIELDTGLGFIENCIVDAHFIHRARFGRLAHAVILHQECWGIGLSEIPHCSLKKAVRQTAAAQGWPGSSMPDRSGRQIPVP